MSNSSHASGETFNLFEFLAKNNLLTSMMTTVITFKLMDLMGEFVDCMIFPKIGIKDKDGGELDEEEKGQIKTKRFLAVFIKFIVVVYVIFLFLIFVKKIE